MEFKFDAHQEHQIRAVESVVRLFEGQTKLETNLEFQLGSAAGAVANKLDLPESVLLDNVQRVQEDNGIDPVDDELLRLGDDGQSFFNFSIEMETGTGKTYVYLRTALELFRNYGYRKFVIVVPSVAIREGVLKEFAVTRKAFRELFGKLPYRSYVYDSSNLTQLRQFALSDSVEFLVMTLASFNKEDNNVIYQPTDQLTEVERPVELIQAVRPILILDEPQNMESELSIKSLASLRPLLALRYSATHRNPYNLLYRLTPFEAYRQGLVKRIQVASVLKEDDVGQPLIRVDEIRSRGRSVTARLIVHKLMKSGTVKEGAVTVRYGDSLEDKTKLHDYNGFEVDEINPGGGYVRFANNTEVREGESHGADREVLFGEQIRYTIEQHFRHQARVADDGVKVLSLFFIDKVANYAEADGVIRRLFQEHFDELKSLPEYEAWSERSSDEVQAGYFSQKIRREGEVEWVETRSGESKEDRAAYNLIMKDKEKLLQFEEPVSFIFSHSALREGWDNPNVFQICTLNQTSSDMKKRQEVGRGVRLCRNQIGDRVIDDSVNLLTVVANESYRTYVDKLQKEIEDEYGKEGVPPPPPNARNRGKATLQKARVLSPEFKELWDRISHKTRYAVTIDSEALVSDVAARLSAVTVSPPQVAVTKVQLDVDDVQDQFEALQLSGAKTVRDLSGRYPLPNVVDVLENLMEQTSPPMRLTRRTLLEIVKASDRTALAKNPHEFALEAVKAIKSALADHLVHGIVYEKLDEWYEMTQFEAEIESWEEYLVPAPNSIYDYVVADSKTVERPFVEGLEARGDVKVYAKLPSWFKVATPVGTYNPDWAVVMEERDQFGDPTGGELCYLVRETKSATWKTSLRPDERRKIDCGRAHFEKALGVSYEVVSDPSQLACPPE